MKNNNFFLINGILLLLANIISGIIKNNIPIIFMGFLTVIFYLDEILKKLKEK